MTKFIVNNRTDAWKTDINRELKHARFWDADGNRKWVIFPFHFLSHNRIYIAMYLFSIRDDKYKNMGNNTVLARQFSSSGCRPCLKNAKYFNILSSRVLQQATVDNLPVGVRWISGLIDCWLFWLLFAELVSGVPNKRQERM